MAYSDMSNEQQKNLIKSYFDREIEVIRHLNIDDINSAVHAILDAYDREATIYVFGNGGSASTASHFAGDFNKEMPAEDGKTFHFVCLSDNITQTMAIANDYSYEEVFRQPLLNRLKSKDLIIAISGSGNSTNIIRAVEYAKEVGTPVLGITGYDGGKLKEMADFHMDVNIDDMQISEDLHMIFHHMVYYVVNQR